MEVQGPVGTATSQPFGSATARGGEAQRLMAEFDFVEEEFFVSGTSGVYGPELAATDDAGVSVLEPLSTLRETGVPYRTRVLVIRPNVASGFSGVVHVVAFHNLYAHASVERHRLRRGDAWVGVEVCSGTRFGAAETPSGGVVNLQRVDPARYASLHVAGGDPAHWGKLEPGAVGRAFEHINFGQRGPALEVFVQELCRSYAQGPDIFFDVVAGLRSGHGPSVLPGFDVRRVYSTAASGGTQFLRPVVEYHHDRHRSADGGPLIDGYLFLVGQVPVNRPRDAVLAVCQSEAEAIRPIAGGAGLSANSDEPRFRYYEIPGCGHSSVLPGGEHEIEAIARVLPAGIQGISARSESDEYEPCDKTVTPIVWALWQAMYEWVEDGVPMPVAEPITRDAAAPQVLTRDEYGNALGGLRTPWVDVPDARYVARRSIGNPLVPGMKRFPEDRFASLYGTRDAYERRVAAAVDRLVRQRWVLPEDAPAMSAAARARAADGAPT